MSALRIIGLALLVAAAGCGRGPQPSSPDLMDLGEPTEGQPTLQTLKLWVGREELVTELALSPREQRTGMMFRTHMADNAGMLFPMPEPRVASFWMKNCPLPLSVAYLDSGGIIKEIHDLEPYNTNAVVSANGDIRFALETPRGWFEKHQIHEGVAVATERGPLLQAIFGKGSR